MSSKKQGAAGWGGARPGAGRKPKEPVALPVGEGSEDPQAFLRGVMQDTSVDMKLRLDAAKALMPFVHKRLDAAGKKEDRQDAAKKVAAGRFAPAAPPRLVANNG